MTTPEPPESILRGQVDTATWMTYPRKLRIIRRCDVCRRLYRLACFAWDCEHWHERKP